MSVLASAHSEMFGEIVFGRVVERAVGDAVHGAAHELGRGDPTEIGKAIGSATEAGTEAGRFGRGRMTERQRVSPQRRGRTALAAVDAGRDDAGECFHADSLGQLTRHIRT
jgi:hypothetical protein